MVDLPRLPERFREGPYKDYVEHTETLGVIEVNFIPTRGKLHPSTPTDITAVLVNTKVPGNRAGVVVSSTSSGFPYTDAVDKKEKIDDIHNTDYCHVAFFRNGRTTPFFITRAKKVNLEELVLKVKKGMALLKGQTVSIITKELKDVLREVGLNV